MLWNYKQNSVAELNTEQQVREQHTSIKITAY